MDPQEERPADEQANGLLTVAVVALLVLLAVVAWQIASLQP